VADIRETLVELALLVFRDLEHRSLNAPRNAERIEKPQIVLHRGLRHLRGFGDCLGEHKAPLVLSVAYPRLHRPEEEKEGRAEGMGEDNPCLKRELPHMGHRIQKGDDSPAAVWDEAVEEVEAVVQMHGGRLAN